MLHTTTDTKLESITDELSTEMFRLQKLQTNYSEETINAWMDELTEPNLNGSQQNRLQNIAKNLRLIANRIEKTVQEDKI